MTSRRPLALLVPSLGGGGAEKVAVLLADAFSRSGRSVDLLTLAPGGEFEALVSAGVRLLPIGKGGTLRNVLALRDYLRTTHPVGIISFLPYGNLVAVLARMLSMSRTPLWFSFHTHHSTALRVGTRGERRVLQLLKALRRQAAGWIVPSRAIEADMTRQLGWTGGRFEVIPNPVAIDEIVESASKPTTHRWFGESEGPPVILAVGRLVPAKDFATLIGAIERVVQKTPVRLLILGEGPERERLELLVRERQLSAVVDMPGFWDNPFPEMRAARLLASSSAWEGFGNVLVEAMVLGTPIVAAACPGGPSEILESGAWGHLVPPGQVEALAQAIRDALAGPARTPALERARAFDVDIAAARYLALIDSATHTRDATAAGVEPRLTT